MLNGDCDGSTDGGGGMRVESGGDFLWCGLAASLSMLTSIPFRFCRVSLRVIPVKALTFLPLKALTGIRLSKFCVFLKVLLLPTYLLILRRNLYKMFGLASKKRRGLFANMNESLDKSYLRALPPRLGCQHRTYGNLVDQLSLFCHCARSICKILRFPKHY